MNVKISNQAQARAVCDEWKPDLVITLRTDNECRDDFNNMRGSPESFDLLIIYVDDIFDVGAADAFQEHDARKIIDWVSGYVEYKPYDSKFLVTCQGATSRSPAVALGMLAWYFTHVASVMTTKGNKNWQERIKEFMSEYIGVICPNKLIAEIFDEYLELNGELLALSEWFVQQRIEKDDN